VLVLAQYARQVTMLVRGPSLAESMSDYLVRDLDRTRNVDIRLDTEIVAAVSEPSQQLLTTRDHRSGQEGVVAAAAVFVLIGATPATDWLPRSIQRDRWGYLVTGKDVHREDGAPPPAPFETSLPGVFAVGDVRHGSSKRVASAVGEGSVCIRSVHDRLAAVASGHGS
jgi:thioredoxin reductase (NADPH)